MIRKNYQRRYRKQEEPYRVNGRILADKVRLVGENVKSDIYPIEKARKMAEDQGLDLVEIAANANPPVCSIVDYTKFKYQKKKKEKELKAKATNVKKKEIRLRPNTGAHDIAVKQRHAMDFLKGGNVVSVYLQLRGREMKYKESAKENLENFLENLKPHGAVMKYPPKQVGRRFFMTIELDKKKLKN